MARTCWHNAHHASYVPYNSTINHFVQKIIKKEGDIKMEDKTFESESDQKGGKNESKGVHRYTICPH